MAEMRDSLWGEMRRAMLEMRGERKDPDAYLPSGKRSEEMAVAPGDRGHSHIFLGVPWNERRFGPHMSDESKFYATFRFLFRCSCGAEKIVTRRGFLSRHPK